MTFLLNHNKVSAIELLPLHELTPAELNHYLSIISLLCKSAEKAQLWKAPWSSKVYLILQNRKKTVRKFSYRILVALSKHIFADAKHEENPPLITVTSVNDKKWMQTFVESWVKTFNSKHDVQKYVTYFIENVA